MDLVLMALAGMAISALASRALVKGNLKALLALLIPAVILTMALALRLASLVSP